MRVSAAFSKFLSLILVVLMATVWFVLGMVYFDRFFQPFDRLRLLFMPWKKLFATPQGESLEQRLSFMRGLLDSSERVLDITLFIMVSTFVILSIYLTFVYQQRYRRLNENKLLLAKNREITRRNEFIRYISATISHEFKNNLGRIKRRIDLLSELPREAREHIDDNLDKLFADIDIFKRISDERESGLVDFEEVNMREMLVGLAAQYSDMADIEFQDNMLSPSIFASRILLQTVFENLIDNAIKYKRPEHSRAFISVSCSLDSDGRRRYVSLSFRDKGIGMDEQQADKCFYKGKSAKGWGEGLYFAKYAVGLHAGKIRVGKEYTAPGKGTEIIMNLPFVEEALDV